MSGNNGVFREAGDDLTLIAKLLGNVQESLFGEGNNARVCSRAYGRIELYFVGLNAVQCMANGIDVLGVRVKWVRKKEFEPNFSGVFPSKAGQTLN